MRHLVGAAVEGAVVDGAVGIGDRHGIGRSGNLVFEQFVDASLRIPQPRRVTAHNRAAPPDD